ncbi:MFS transporter [Ferrimicrobium sp.]|uniref:MFS transporter n=1 Tax=Ferrimicrobium sp. TaxID=2926050 RepID=UPI00262B775B|nr:MFS transporter [Ferrimicrobium sp.]
MEVVEKGPGRRRLRGNPWFSLVAVAFGVIMVGLDATVVSIANPFIARGLHANLADLQWVTNGYLLVTAVLLIPAGKLGDRLGRRKIYLIGMAGFALASAGVGLSGSIGLVITFRAFQGAFGALIMPNTLAILRKTFPLEKLNTAIGVWGATSAIAIAGGPIVGGLLVQDVSWQSVFYLNVPVAIIGIIISVLVLHESRETDVESPDYPGIVTLAASLFLLVFGLIKTQTWGWADPKTLACFGGAIVAAGLFIFAEGKVTNPLVPLRIFASRALSMSTISVILNFFAFYGVIFFVSLYLQEVHGYTPIEAGVRLLPLTAMFVISAPLGAVLNHHFGPRFPVTIGMLLSAGGLWVLTSLEVSSNYLLLAIPFVILGLGVGFVLTATSDAIVGNAPSQDAGVAGGVQSTALQIGGVIGTSVLGSVLLDRVGSTLVGKLTHAGVPGALAPKILAAKPLVAEGAVPRIAHIPPALQLAITNGSHAAFLSGLHVAMVVAIAVSLLGAVTGFAIGNKRPSEDQESEMISD